MLTNTTEMNKNKNVKDIRLLLSDISLERNNLLFYLIAVLEAFCPYTGEFKEYKNITKTLLTSRHYCNLLKDEDIINLFSTCIAVVKEKEDVISNEELKETILSYEKYIK